MFLAPFFFSSGNYHFHYSPGPINWKLDNNINICAILPAIFLLWPLFWAFHEYVKSIKSYQMEIKLDKDTFTLGESITGTCKLNLLQSVKARGILLEVYSIESPSGKKRGSKYSLKQQIGNNRAYQNGEEFPFSLKIPSDWPLDKIKSQSWQLSATLDMPLDIDIASSKNIKIQNP